MAASETLPDDRASAMEEDPDGRDEDADELMSLSDEADEDIQAGCER